MLEVLVLESKNPYKLYINRKEDIFDNGPIIPRCYEVTYLKASKSMSINIDKNEEKSISLYKGEGLCGRWCFEDGKYILFFQINIDAKKKGYDKTKERNRLVRNSIPLMINAIRRADEKFYEEYKYLDEAEIFIKFNSLYDEFFKVECWGKLKNYIKIELYDENKIKEKQLNSILIKRSERINMQNNLILNLINHHIEVYLFSIYGRNIRFIIKDMNILNIEEINLIGGIEKNHKVIVSVKVLERDKIEEILLNVMINPNNVRIKSVR